MLDMMKKTFFTGIGLALRTRDEVEDMGKDWAKTQELSEEEGRRFLDDLMKRYDSSMEKMEEKIEGAVKKVLKKANLATRDELEDLRKEVEQLRETLKNKTSD